MIKVTKGTYAKLHRYNHKKCGTRPRIAIIGILMKPAVEIEPGVGLHKYEYTEAGTMDCGTYPYTDTVGAGILASAAAVPDAAYSLYGFTKCGTRRCGQLI